MKTQPVPGLVAVLLALASSAHVEAQYAPAVPGTFQGAHGRYASIPSMPGQASLPGSVLTQAAPSQPSYGGGAPVMAAAPVAPAANPPLPYTESVNGGAGCGVAGCDSAGCTDMIGYGMAGGYGMGSGYGCVDGACGVGGGRLGGAGCGGFLTQLFHRGGMDGCGGGFGGPAGGGYASMGAGMKHGPLGDGGCCAPRWFDVHVEWMYLERDAIAGDDHIFSSDGILGPPALSTGGLDDLGRESGFRVTGAYLIGPSTNLELTYFGAFNWAASGEVTSATDNLYSVISDFGAFPSGGYQETDEGDLHRLAYSSELDNAELNLRRRWISANCLFHTSFLAGVRYLRLREDLTYYTRSTVRNGELNYDLGTDNDLIGFQIGTESAICLTPRFKLGAEIEAGVYGARTKQSTHVTATTVSPDLIESVKDNDAAFVGEAGVFGLFRITPRLTARAGYTVLYVNGVALAADNFNPESPNQLVPLVGRDPFIDNNGDALFHGANLGLEWTW